MKPRAIFGTTILASVLALGISCKTPLVEGPASLRTRQCHARNSHPCTNNVIEGGLNTTCHILFQIHEDPISQKVSEKAVRSQILLHHLISDLIKNYGVGVVFLEGMDISEDVRKILRSKCDKKCSDDARAAFQECVSDMMYGRGPRGWLPRSLSKHGAEDFCFAKILWHSSSLRDFSKFLVVLNNQSVLFTGFERDRKKHSQEIKKQRLLLRLGKSISQLFSLGPSSAFEVFADLCYKEEMETRLNYVNKDAIMEAISHSFVNTALIMGVGHKEQIEGAVRAIPFDERPTFYFIMPECQDVWDYSVSSHIIEQAAKESSKTR